MTAQGTPLTRFRRAVESGSLLLAELSAREVGRLSLEEALALTALYATEDSAKFDRAAVRWLVRYATERQPGLADMQLAAVALATLPADSERGLRILRELRR